MLQEVSGDKEYIFNPTGWILDEAGAEWNAIRIVFGETALSRVASCEFHYKQSVNRKSAKLNGNRKTRFETLAYALLEANTASVFEKRRADLNRFIKEKPDESKLLSSWVEWWDKRKTHIFRAFKGGLQTPRMNMAETGHSTWVKAGAIQLTLVDAARHDFGENVRLEKTVQGFMEGSLKSTGKGPSGKEVDRRLRESQLQGARLYGKEIVAQDFEGDAYSPIDAVGFVDPQCSHSPTKRGRGKQAAKSGKREHNKQVAKSLNGAKTEAMNLDGMVQIATDHVKFMVRHGQSSYEVDICHTLSCSCPDWRPCNCKHILWVLLHILNVQENGPLVQDRRPGKDTLRKILSTPSCQSYPKQQSTCGTTGISSSCSDRNNHVANRDALVHSARGKYFNSPRD